jgi:hypothetical protein
MVSVPVATGIPEKVNLPFSTIGMPVGLVAHKAAVRQKSRTNFQSQNLHSRQGHLDSQWSYVHVTLHVTYDHGFDNKLKTQT